MIIDGLSKTEESGFVAPDKLSEVLAQIKGGTRLMIMGGKGSGKSSANRFIVNRLLNMGHSKVYWFELDPGQPEFNISGWMNLVEVSEARIGPGFAFLKSKTHYKTIASSFLGELSPGNDPAKYMECVHRLRNV
jgi:polynucleotide 5'-kinase involved in rRNA processing